MTALRKVVHITMGGFALLLRYLTVWQAALCALAALVHNLWILPRWWGRRLIREEEMVGSVPVGIVAYPLSVLILILVFGHTMFIVAGAWAVMAFGDGLAGLLGPMVGRIRWPWNPRKTLEGTLAFVAGGSLGSAAMIMWTTGGQVPDTLSHLSASVVFWWIPLGVTLLMAVFETLDLCLNDNITIPLGAGLLFFIAYHVDWPQWIERIPWDGALFALAVNALVGIVAYVLRWVDWSGLGVGLMLGFVILWLGGWVPYALLVGFFTLGSLATRLGYQSKRARGLAEEPRGWRSAIAKAGPPAVLTVWWALAPPAYQVAIVAAITAAFAAALMDTVGSEIGKWRGRRAFLWWCLRTVSPGTPGAMSGLGTVAGLLAGLALAVLGSALWDLPGAVLKGIVTAMIGANLLESFLGYVLRPRGMATAYEINAVLVIMAAGGAFAWTASL